MYLVEQRAQGKPPLPIQALPLNPEIVAKEDSFSRECGRHMRRHLALWTSPIHMSLYALYCFLSFTLTLPRPLLAVSGSFRIGHDVKQMLRRTQSGIEREAGATMK